MCWITKRSNCITVNVRRYQPDIFCSCRVAVTAPLPSWSPCTAFAFYSYRIYICLQLVHTIVFFVNLWYKICSDIFTLHQIWQSEADNHWKPCLSIKRVVSWFLSINNNKETGCAQTLPNFNAESWVINIIPCTPTMLLCTRSTFRLSLNVLKESKKKSWMNHRFFLQEQSSFTKFRWWKAQESEKLWDCAILTARISLIVLMKSCQWTWPPWPKIHFNNDTTFARPAENKRSICLVQWSRDSWETAQTFIHRSKLNLLVWAPLPLCWSVCPVRRGSGWT